MYRHILIPLENSRSDKAILEHIRGLAKHFKSNLVLVHVADGFAARLQDELNLEDSQEIREDRKYLKHCQEALEKEGLKVTAHLLAGDPTKQILAIAEKEKVDLIAMSTHGHGFLKDLILGSVASNLRHKTRVPVLMIKAPR